MIKRDEKQRLEQDEINSIEMAREWIAQKPVYLDTETTGLDNKAQIVDIAIIDSDGIVLLDTPVRPTEPIPEEATNIHGITNEMIADAPTYAQVMANIQIHLAGRLVIIYNADYDLRLMKQSAQANKVEPWIPQATCAMELYAQYWGDWNEYHGNYRWQSQAKAAKQLNIESPGDLHRAQVDAQLCRLIVEAMANTPLPGEEITAKEMINIAYSLIDDLIRNFPPCNCNEGYKSRDMIDPNCTHCNAIEDDTYNGLVDWRNKAGRNL